MPIISPVEAKSTHGRLVHLAIIVVLTLGGITCIYPFAIMTSGALRSEMDESDLDLIPRYMVDAQVLTRKFLETKYNQDVAALNRGHCRTNFSFREAQVPSEVHEAELRDLEGFLAAVPPPHHWQVLGGAYGVKTTPEQVRELRDRLFDMYEGNLDALQRDVGTAISAWNTIVVPPPQPWTQRFDYPSNALYDVYFELMDEAPQAQRQLVSLTGVFLETMVYPTYGQSDVADFNKAHRVAIGSFDEFALPSRVPDASDPALRREWIEFVTVELNPSFVVLDDVPAEAFQAALKAEYGEIAKLNETWVARYEGFGDVPLPQGEWLSGTRRTDYEEFLLDQAPEHWRLVGPESAWRDWLRERYPSVGDLNTAYGSSYASFDAVRMPVEQLEYDYVLANARTLRKTYAERNFINVCRELFLHGRAFANTMTFCGMAILTALIINPLAAYALSRFQLPGTYKILLLLMATMAFPPMVTMIPAFILMRKLQMLNTFAALIVPMAANGYMIFLLKGFFDSLPRDLYEAATLDGASELRMFLQVTMALSKPILAVVALGAFNAAYSTFLYALIVCPSEKMWMLSVWLYQWQQNSSTSGVFASVIVASIPTLLVFVFCQKVIMRGIVVPVEK